MKKNEKKSSVLGFLGFAVSLLTLGVSMWGPIQTTELHKDQMKFDSEGRRSKIVLQIGRDLSQEKIVFSKSRIHSGAIYKQRYNLLLNNIGFQVASIGEWIVYANSSAFFKGGSWYEGMGPWYYALDGSEIELPIIIEQNKPKKIVIEIGVLIPSFVWESVSQNLSFDKEYDYYEAEQIFTERGYPQFGFHTLIRDSHKAAECELAPFQQDFTLYLTKGDGTRVAAKFSPSVNYSFVQGENSGTPWENLIE